MQGYYYLIETCMPNNWIEQYQYAQLSCILKGLGQYHRLCICYALKNKEDLNYKHVAFIVYLVVFIIYV